MRRFRRLATVPPQRPPNQLIMEDYMDRQTADIAIQFLARVNLNAEEIPAFMQVKRALEDISLWEPPEAKLEVVEPTHDLADK